MYNKNFFYDVEKYDNEILNNINDDRILGENNNISLMTLTDRKFVNGIIRKIKPKKILEVGVASGSGSVLLLNAIRDIDEAKLYSIDYLERWWEDSSKEIGYLVKDVVPELLPKWTIYRGGVAAKFMDEIGKDIDVCMLDTMHMNPGEFLDFLMILPFLKENAVLIIHDIQVHLYDTYKNKHTCCSLLATLKGEKIFPNDDIRERSFPNIGAVILDSNIKNYINDILLLLTLDWTYNISIEDHYYTSTLLKKYYEKNVYLQYNKIYDNNNNSSNDNNEYILKEHILLENKLNRLINSIAWYIPVKKWRDNFRSKILNG